MQASSSLMLALMISIVLEIISACPTECYCIGTVRVIVYCDFRNLDRIPNYMPVETTHLYLNGNNFKELKGNMLIAQLVDKEGKWSDEFAPLKNLRVLRVDGNPKIVKVNEHAFDGFSDLETIYLPRGTKIQREVLGELRLDKESFDGFFRVPIHPLEDPDFVAFSKFQYNYTEN